MSRAFRKIIDADPEIQYRKELAILQVQPTELAKDISLSAKLAELRSIRMFRARPRLAQAVKLSAEKPLGVQFGNTFCYAYRTSPALQAEGLYDAVRFTALTYTSPGAQPDVENWEHVFDVEFHTLCADETQDLLVLLRWDKTNYLYVVIWCSCAYAWAEASL